MSYSFGDIFTQFTEMSDCLENGVNALGTAERNRYIRTNLFY